MGLEEAARRIYGVPTQYQPTADWVSRQYGTKPWQAYEQQAAKIRSDKKDQSAALSAARQPTRTITKARKAGRKGLTTRSGFSPQEQSFWYQTGVSQGFGGGQLPDGTPAYMATSSAPGSYQMAQQARQESEGLYQQAHVMDPGNWSTEALSKLQRQLVQAGLLTDRFRLGVFDSQTKNAYEELLSLANSNGGKTKGEMLSQLVATAPDDLADYYRKPAFVEPDRKMLVEDIESVFEQRLGRAPTAEERKHLADHYARQFRKEYQLETLPTAWNQFADSAGDAISGADITLAGGRGAAMAQQGLGQRNVRDVDPGQRFASYFRKRYRNEENERRLREEQEELQVTAAQGFEQLRSMMAAGGVQQLGS